jgi:hypothetical protein
MRGYTPDRAGEALIVCGPGRGVPGGWPGQRLSLVVDGAEHLLALLPADLDQVHQAVWSGSAFLSCLQHNHLSMELMLAARAGGGVGGVEGTNDDLSGITVLASEPEGLRRCARRWPGGRVRRISETKTRPRPTTTRLRMRGPAPS